MEIDAQLIDACKNCRVSRAKELLAAAPHLLNKCIELEEEIFRCTPLQHAIRAKCLELVEAFCGVESIDLEAIDKDGWTALHHASAIGFSSGIKSLALHGTNLNATIPGGATALHIAASERKIKTLETLIGLGADPNVQEDEKGDTALHEAIRFSGGDEKCEAVRAILAGKVDLNIRNKKGQTPFELANSLGRSFIAQLIVEGSKQNAERSQDEEGPHRLADEGEEEFHKRSWKMGRNGDSLYWLYDKFISTGNGHTCRAEIIDLLGDPTFENADKSFSTYVSADKSVDIHLRWSGSKLIAWKCM